MAKAHFNANPTDKFNFAAYRRPDVKMALEIMFDAKCAYCEARFMADSDGGVEHYRPKGRLVVENHPGYWWLAAQWQNLLATCQHCNEIRGQIIVTPGMSMEEATRLHRETLVKPTHGKGSQFPIRGKRRLPMSHALNLEDALLINPTTQDPKKHLYFPPDTGISLAVPHKTLTGPDEYGLATINVTALNRYQLVRERTVLLMDLRKHVLDLERSIDEAETAPDQAAKDAATGRSTAALAAIEAYAAKGRRYSAVAYWLHQRLIEWMRAERDTGAQLPVPTLIDAGIL
ncbi:hypothetical protein [Ensifer sp. ENS11]|uniref:hypothetical protein n=1 Tax=Ensifer sp. ENS11 TaxID=2769291 RepID=UPI00177F3E61|nr:hypothetical protein [Ensifer sp. ENS11]MBD9486273.1 hypothetical protein [Ensifer sp. ENS11]